jgi:hypothetical protein
MLYIIIGFITLVIWLSIQIYKTWNQKIAAALCRFPYVILDQQKTKFQPISKCWLVVMQTPNGHVYSMLLQSTHIDHEWFSNKMTELNSRTAGTIVHLLFGPSKKRSPSKYDTSHLIEFKDIQLFAPGTPLPPAYIAVDPK